MSQCSGFDTPKAHHRQGEGLVSPSDASRTVVHPPRAHPRNGGIFLGRESAAFTRQRREVEVECARLGIVITVFGQAFQLTGRGVNLRVSDLRHVLPDDLATIDREPTN